MNEEDQTTDSDTYRTYESPISRRAVVGSSGMAILGLLSGTVLAQGGAVSEAAREARERAVERAREAAHMAGEATLRERYGQPDSDFFEKMRTSDVETRAKMMRDWQSQRMLERLKAELKISEEEWAVIKPRIEAVYGLMHTQAAASDDETEVSVAQRIRELRELLALPEAKPEAIKARLTLLRAAREQVQQKLIKARQELRKIMTLRQEAVLILYGLLD